MAGCERSATAARRAQWDSCRQIACVDAPGAGPSPDQSDVQLPCARCLRHTDLPRTVTVVVSPAQRSASLKAPAPFEIPARHRFELLVGEIQLPTQYAAPACLSRSTRALAAAKRFAERALIEAVRLAVQSRRDGEHLRRRKARACLGSDRVGGRERERLRGAPGSEVARRGGNRAPRLSSELRCPKSGPAADPHHRDGRAQHCEPVLARGRPRRRGRREPEATSSCS